MQVYLAQEPRQPRKKSGDNGKKTSPLISLLEAAGPPSDLSVVGPTLCDVPPVSNITIVPYTPVPYGERKGFPRLEGHGELEQGLMTAMGTGLEMPVGQQSLLDAFFVDEEGYHVVTNAQAIPVSVRDSGSGGAASSLGSSDGGSASLLNSAWRSARRALGRAPGATQPFEGGASPPTRSPGGRLESQNGHGHEPGWDDTMEDVAGLDMEDVGVASCVH
ncbi:Breast carcinoma amplified sequence 3 [Polyrhizophydium stewartii]|uniref:Breast carcinoma amplified sequence 3 n=1 Tax=Polyrhizophydium stewartii TaxID=2732419 RepID=A0ABR4N5U1_9FUNG